jgi:hypothetical protein
MLLHQYWIKIFIKVALCPLKSESILINVNSILILIVNINTKAFNYTFYFNPEIFYLVFISTNVDSNAISQFRLLINKSDVFTRIIYQNIAYIFQKKSFSWSSSQLLSEINEYFLPNSIIFSF